MKFLITVIIFFVVNGLSAQSDPLLSLEQLIEKNCFNCNQSNLNKYLISICEKRERSLDSICKEFDNQVSKVRNDSVYKLKLVTLKNETLTDILETRRKNIVNYLELKENSSENDFNGYFLYIYWTERALELIKYYMRSIDFN